MLSDLTPPAPSVIAPNGWRPAVEFDEVSGEGTATTQGLVDAPNFDEFLRQAGYDPAVYEVVGNTVRTSKWQQREGGDWLTSYRFTFRLKNKTVDLPLLWATARKKLSKQKPVVATDKALVVLWSDLQIGKVDSRGGVDQLVERCELTKQRVIDLIKKEKPERIIFCDMGDIVEGFDNAANQQQLQSNDLSPMQQIDLAVTLVWDFLTTISRLVPDITYLTVGSNHCQWRSQKQRVGKPVDDWGVFIAGQIKRLSDVSGVNIAVHAPHPHDESLAWDVFGDGFHVLGLWHGHQYSRPDEAPRFWRNQAFGKQPIHAATIGVSGHFHHLRITELGSTPRGTSRFWIQASTLDNGSSWWRLNAGEDSQPGLVCFVLAKDTDFTGTVFKL